MSQIWIYTLASVVIVSLISLIGILIIVLSQNYIKKFLLFMVSFAAGGLLGGAFLHLLPELIAEGHFSVMTSIYILLGILIFFILEKILHWRHCHLTATKSHVHTLGYMNLIGDAFHNFTDGILIAGSYMLSIPIGIATTIAVIMHEIPQEMGDFGVLLHSGMKAKKALLLNFLSALTAVLGALIILVFGVSNENLVQIIIPITIGGFIYIASSDLIPELHKDIKIKNSIIQLISLIIGIGIMFLLTFTHTHNHDDSHGLNNTDYHNHVHDAHYKE